MKLLKRNQKDERIERAKERIGRKGFQLLVLGVSIDLMIKLAYWRPGIDAEPGIFLIAGLEMIMLLLSVLYVIFAASKEGILLASEDQETPVFPKKLYLLFASWCALFVLGSVLIRFLFYPHWEADMAAFILIIGGLMAITFGGCYGVCLLVFKLAFKKAVNVRNDNLSNDEGHI